MKRFVFAALVLTLSFFVAQGLYATGGGGGENSLAALNAAYTQDFNTLAATGTVNPLAINGWYLDETGSSTSNNGQYRASTGSDNAGDTYSFGTDTDRALGTLLSGTLTPTIG